MFPAPDKMSITEGVELPLLRKKEAMIMDRIGLVSEQIVRLEMEQKLNTEAAVNNILREMPRLLRFELKMDRLEEYLGIVNIADLDFKR